MSLRSPYDHIPPDRRHKMGARVDIADVAYIERLYPMAVGLQDRILSTLFHRFIQHLKSLEHQNGTPIEPAWFVGSPTYVLLDLILERCNFDDIPALVAAAELRGHAAGRAAGPDAGDNDSGGAGGVCPAVCGPEEQRTNKKGKPRKGGNSRGRKASAEEKGQCGTGAGVAPHDAETQDIIR